MIEAWRSATRSRKATIIGLAVCSVLAFVSAFAAITLAGTKTGFVLAFAAAAGPILAYLALVMPAVVPFGVYTVAVPFDGLLGTDTTGSITRLIGLASIAALLFYILRTKRAVEPPNATMAWVVYYLWATASIFWAYDAKLAQSVLPTELSLFAMYVVTTMFPISKRHLAIVAALMVGSGVIAAVYGIHMYYSGGVTPATRIFLVDSSAALNPDHYSGAMILPVAIAIVALFWSKKLWVKAISVISIVAMLWAVEITGARGAVVGLGVVVLYLLWRDARHRTALFAIAVTLAAVVLAASGGGMIQRFAEAGANGGAGRMDIWHVGIVAFKDNWLTGAGYNNFSLAYDHALIRVPQMMFTRWDRDSHNILLRAGVELGSIGLVLFLIAWAGQMTLARFIKPDSEYFPYRLAAESAILGLFVSGMFADIMIQKYPWLAFILIAMTRNAALLHHSRAKEPIARCATPSSLIASPQ